MKHVSSLALSTYLFAQASGTFLNAASVFYTLGGFGFLVDGQQIILAAHHTNS